MDAAIDRDNRENKTMGYTTDFNGTLKLNKKLDAETHAYLVKFNETRRMARDTAKLKTLYNGKGGLDGNYGTQGEYFVEGHGFMGQDNDDSVIDHNRPPKTQPGLWCQWRPTDDGTGIEWDGGEKFYDYVTWLEYIIDNVLKPKGYIATGAIQWRGENFDDMGTILVIDNVVTVKTGEHVALPKAKKVKATGEVVIKSRKIDGNVYFRADSVIETLKTIKQDETLTKGLIRELERMAKR